MNTNTQKKELLDTSLLEEKLRVEIQEISSAYDEYPHSCWFEVDLGQFRKNIQIIEEFTGTPVLVVLKSNAYGHGLVPCAKAAVESGARMLGVATYGEAAMLRDHGIEADILRITAYHPDEIPFMIAHDIDFFVWNAELVDFVRDFAQKLQKKAKIHLKIDTGMGRLGVFPEKAAELAKKIANCNDITFVGVATHFHSAEAEDSAVSQKQINLFNGAVEQMKADQTLPDMVHMANSRGLLKFPGAHYNMVRSGIVTYGIGYEPGFDLLEGMKPIGQWKARVVSVRDLPAGHGVSYGQTYVTGKEEKVAIVPVGYGDGLHRTPPDRNRFLIGGRELPVAGRVCMDQCMVIIPDDMDVQVGDDVVVMGDQHIEGETHSITARDISLRWETNRHEVLVSIDPRVPRVYR